MTGPRNSTTTTSGARTYKWKGEEFPSVTTVLSAGVPKPALTTWAANSVAEYVADEFDSVAAVLRPNGKQTATSRSAAYTLMKGAPWRHRDHRAAVGTLVHTIAESRALGTPLPKMEAEHEVYVPVVDAFLEAWQPDFVASEMTVYNRQYRYAGTLDFIAKLPGVGMVLGDYKTSKPGRQGHGIYPETVLQLAAYRNAEFAGLPDGTEEPMPAVDACIAVNLRPTGFVVVPLECGEDQFLSFLDAMGVAAWAKDGKRYVGDPLNPPASEGAAS